MCTVIGAARQPPFVSERRTLKSHCRFEATGKPEQALLAALTFGGFD